MKLLITTVFLTFFANGITSVVLAESTEPKVDQPPAANKTSHGKEAPSEAPSLAELAGQLEQLKQALAAQQEQIERLNAELARRDEQIRQAIAAAAEFRSSANNAISDVQTRQTEFFARVGQDEKKADAVQENTSEKIRALSSLKLDGDLRLRSDTLIGGGLATSPANAARPRERIRLRLNLTSQVNDNLALGLSFASGDLGDPTSTNSTETGFLTRKPIAIDKAFAVYTPHFFKPLTVTAGKYAYTWYRTELTFDNDLNPEGASETLGWDWNEKFLSHLAFVAFQTPVFEVGGGPDSAIFGEQIQSGWKLARRVRLTADAAFYDYRNPNLIAQDQTGAVGNGAATQGAPTIGGGNFGFGTSDPSNNFGVINGKRVFASKFGIFDSILRADLDTGIQRLPVYVLFNYAENTRACSNLQAFVDAGVAPPACDKNQRHAYWAEAQFGQTKNKNDFRIGYTFMRIERDAVVGAFNFSEIRRPTNVAEHRFDAFFQASKNITLGFTGFTGHQLVNSQSPSRERYLKRLQFDTIFAF